MKLEFRAPHAAGARSGPVRARAGMGRAGMNNSAPKNVKNPCTAKNQVVSQALRPHRCRSGATRAILSRIGQMSSLAALEKRVKALEDDEFSKPSYVPPPPPAASSASSAEVDELRKENAKLQDLLAKERYRIKHLIRAIEAKS